MKRIFLTILFITSFSNFALADEAAFSFAKSRHHAIISGGRNIRLEIDKTLDYDTLIINSMGDEWSQASDHQKSEIKRLLKSIIRHSLEKRLRKINSKDVRWLGYEDTESGLTIAKSVVEYKKPIEEFFEINYHIIKKPEGYKVIDIIFDGVSTVDTYKRQFKRLVKAKGFDALIEKLKEKDSQNLIDEDDGC